MAPTRLSLIQQRVNAWNAANPHAPLDQRAVIAVAAQEGLGGEIGDAGTSFGPWQLHVGGAFPSGVVPSGGEQAWAWSPAGIDYALRHIASVAGGKRGAEAVNAIVARFERPANIPGEIARATGALGTTPLSGSVAPAVAAIAPGNPSSAPGGDLAPLILALLNHPAAAPPVLAPLPGSLAAPLTPTGAPAPASAFTPFPKL